MGNFYIERINKLSSFKEIRDEWEQLYQSDPNSTIFTTWTWQYGWFSKTDYEWVILGVKKKDSSSYVAFLPLTIYNRRSYGIVTNRQIVFGGKPISIYSGFLCAPDFESETLRLLAEFIQSNLKWDTLQFNWVKDLRLDIFAGAFQSSGFSVENKKSLTSLRINLPNDYQVFLREFVSKDRRWYLRSKDRFIQQNESFHISYSSIKTIDRDINALCELWFNRWGRRNEADLQKKIMHHLFNNDLLILILLWDKEKPVSAHAFLVEPNKKTYLSYCTTYDPEYSKMSPGITIVAEGIKNAIDNKYKFFDFTVGLDPYKLSFGPEQIQTKSITIKRMNLKYKVKIIVKNLMRKFL